MSLDSSGNRFAALSVDMSEDGTEVPQAQAPSKVSPPDLLVCSSGIKGVQLLNGAGSSSADAMDSIGESTLSESAQGAVSPDAPQRKPQSTPHPQATTGDEDMETETADAQAAPPAISPSAKLSWADIVQEDLAARDAAANSLKRKKPNDHPQKERVSAPPRQLADGLGCDTDSDTSETPAPGRPQGQKLPTLMPSSVFARRASSRIKEKDIQPAQDKQKVVTGVRRIVALKDGIAQKSSDTNAPTAKRAASTSKTSAKSVARPIQALERRIQAALTQRDEKEAALRGFFETMTSGLRNIEGINALDNNKVETIGVFLSLAASVAFSKTDSNPVSQEWQTYFANLDLSKPMEPLSAPEVSQTATTQVPALDASAWPSLGSARKAPPSKGSKPFLKPTQPALAPLQGYRTQGGTKGDAAKLAADGGVLETRTFIRLADGSPDRDEDPYEIRLRLEKLLSSLGSSASIGRVKAIKSGFSFTPGEKCAASEFEQFYQHIQREFGAESIEGPCKHRQFCLRGLPAKIVSGGVSKTITPQDVHMQVMRRFPSIKLALPPRTITPARHESPAPLWLLTVAEGSFAADASQPCPSRVDIMDRSCSLRPYRANNASKHCGRCLSWHHTTDKCRSPAPSCAHCGLTGHSAKDHVCSLCKPGQPPLCVPECAHCKSPHVTGHIGCRARPVWDSKVNAVIVPEGERLVRIQNSGRTERKLAISRLRAQATQAARAAAPHQALQADNRETSTPQKDPNTNTTPQTVASGPRSNALGES
ncbi:hypothetical protein CF326_g4201 [Tilletia indica]|nr:hypothetical protein CF326_g4201 [Tilletia indica]